MFSRKILVTCLAVLVALALTAPSMTLHAKYQSPASVAILIVDDFEAPLYRVAEATRDNLAVQAAIDHAVERILAGETMEDVLDELVQTIQDLNVVTPALEANREGVLDSTNCAISLEGQDFYTTSGTDVGYFISGQDFYTTSGTGDPKLTAHGTLVEKELKELIAGNPDIIPVEVPIADFNTGLITAAIEDAMANNPADRYVVNLSFAVTSCLNIPTLAIYDQLMRVFAAETAGDMDQLYELFQQLEFPTFFDPTTINMVGDPLAGFLAERANEVDSNGVPTFVPVGAAGNGSQPYPFYPAALPNVVSVSASSAAPGPLQLASYSNAGNIMLPGIWIELPLTIHHGTTYAAPRYSYFMAMYMLGTPEFCNCATVSPCELAPTYYADWLNTPPASPNEPLCPAP